MSEPAAIRALRRSLRGAREPDLRDRLQTAIDGLQKLYGRRCAVTEAERGDLRRRRFVAARHSIVRGGRQ